MILTQAIAVGTAAVLPIGMMTKHCDLVIEEVSRLSFTFVTMSILLGIKAVAFVATWRCLLRIAQGAKFIGKDAVTFPTYILN